MESFIATTIAEARAAKGEFRAGGTDLMERLRHHLSKGPVVDIAGLPGLGEIVMTPTGGCQIGALVTIQQVADNHHIRRQYPGLAMAAGALANPQVRRAASMGGSLLQRNRCWYYRHEDFSCHRKGGDSCPLRGGNDQYGVCFDLGPCAWPHPSTLGAVLMAYEAHVTVEGKGNLPVSELFGDGSLVKADHTLGEGELLSHISLLGPYIGELAGYHRAISRARAEWPLVEVFVRARSNGGMLQGVRVSMGGVANIPMRLPAVEALLEGKRPTLELIKEAGQVATRGATPLPGTKYKVDLIPGTVEIAFSQAFYNLMG